MRIRKSGLFGFEDDNDKFAHTLPMAGVRFLLALASSPAFVFVDDNGSRYMLTDDEQQIIEHTIRQLVVTEEGGKMFGRAWLRNAQTVSIGTTAAIGLEFGGGDGFTGYPFVIPADGYYRLTLSSVFYYPHGLQDPDMQVLLTHRVYGSLTGVPVQVLTSSNINDERVQFSWSKEVYFPAGDSIDYRIFSARGYNYNPNVNDFTLWGAGTETTAQTFMQIRQV